MKSVSGRCIRCSTPYRTQLRARYFYYRTCVRHELSSRASSSSTAVTGAWRGVICASRPRDSLGGTFSLAGEIAGSVGTSVAPSDRFPRANPSSARSRRRKRESTLARRRITRAGCDTHDAMVVGGGTFALSFALSLCPHRQQLLLQKGELSSRPSGSHLHAFAFARSQSHALQAQQRVALSGATLSANAVPRESGDTLPRDAEALCEA